MLIVLKMEYELLNGHNTQENAYIVESYPYGFKRTQKKHWIETTKRGDRLVTQTLNPKSNEWNKPKKSTYDCVKVLVKDLSNDHITTRGLYFSEDRESILKFDKLTESYDFSDKQKEQIRILEAYSKAYENVEVTFKARQYKIGRASCRERV